MEPLLPETQHRNYPSILKLFAGFGLIFTLGCTRTNADDPYMALQGRWHSVVAECGTLSSTPGSLHNLKNLGQSSWEVKGHEAILKFKAKTCENVIAFQIKLESGKMYWQKGKQIKTTCKQNQGNLIGDLIFAYQKRGELIEVTPQNRSLIKCGVLTREAR